MNDQTSSMEAADRDSITTIIRDQNLVDGDGLKGAAVLQLGALLEEVVWVQGVEQTRGVSGIIALWEGRRS